MEVLLCAVVGVVDHVAVLEKRMKEKDDKAGARAAPNVSLMLGVASALRFVEILCLLNLFSGMSALQ